MRIITRTSPLAMWQAEHVRSQLLSHFPELDIKIIGIKTIADQWQNIPLYKLGNKGVFVKELSEALLANEADIAVHSLKDVPATLPDGLEIAAVCQRENPFDAWICPKGYTLDTIPAGSRIGTSSLRRMIQLKRFRPDLEFVSLRGNVDTRLRKCMEGEWDAIVLAVAGIARLNLKQHITAIFNSEQVLPAVGQGALGIECRSNDKDTQFKLAALNHLSSRACIEAERAMNALLGGNCQVPVAGLAQCQGDQLHLIGRVGHPLEAILLEAQQKGSLEKAKQIGEQVAQELIDQGAKRIIDEVIKNAQT